MRIVTDSATDLPLEIARELGITVVPLSVHFGDKTYIDGRDIDSPTFYRLLRSESVHPHTAQPSVGLFEEAYRSLAAEGHEIVTITLAATLSGTHNSAALAARNVPDARVTLIDSGTASMATGILAIHAAHLARQDATAAQIEAAVREMIPRLNVCLLIDTLTYLQRGGRIGRAGSLLGTMLNIKPIITLRDGEVTPIRRVRTRGKALQEIISLVTAEQPIEEMYILQAAAPDEAAELAVMLQPVYAGRPVSVLPLGPVVGVHVGPGALGAVTLRGT